MTRDDISYEPLKESDTEEAIQFFVNEEFTFFSMHGPILAKKTCYEALIDNGPVTVIVSKNKMGRIVGEIVSIIDPKKYLMSTIFRDPYFIIHVIMARIISLLRLILWRDKSCSSHKDLSLDIDTSDESSFPYSWGDRGPNFAHTLAVAVSQEERGKGVGKHLYLKMFEEVKKKGASDMIACVVYGNLPAVFLHKKVGWKLARSKKSWVAWKRL